MTNTIATAVEQKRPHKMLQTPWIILYVYGFDSIETMYAKAKIRFFNVLSVNGNRTLQFLSSVESDVVE